MIYRVLGPTANNTSACAQSTSQKPSNRQHSPTSEVSEAEIESLESAQVDSTAAISKKRYENLRPQLSYNESTEDPFEEVVIRAETYFPGLKNIVRDQTSSYIVEQTSYETLPVSRPFAQPRQHLPTNNSVCHQNPFSASISESKRRGEEEIDRRIMMYSRSNRKPHAYYSPNYHGGPRQQCPPVDQVVHYGNYYAPQALANNFQPPCTSESEVDERTTYDYRDFQAARQRFERDGSVNQTIIPAPRKHPHGFGVRPQHSITQSIVLGGPSESGPTAGGARSVRQSGNPHALHPSTFQSPFILQSPSSQENGVIARLEPHNLFSRGCGCGPGAGCGALPDTPIHREQDNHREAIKKYLVTEEVGPGGVKSIFSFPGGMEPSDLTLLRAAISANRPKDAFIPEEDDDLEEQINCQLGKACANSGSLHPVPSQAPLQPQSQPAMPMQHMQTVSRASNTNILGGASDGKAGGGVAHMVMQHNHQQRPNIVKAVDHAAQEAQPPYGTESPLTTLMYNGISNNFIGPNSPIHQPAPSSHPTYNCHNHSLPNAAIGSSTSSTSGGSWHISSPRQNQRAQSSCQMYTTYDSSRFDPVPVGMGRDPTHPKPSTADGRSLVG